MNRFYVIYFSLRDDGNVVFSTPYTSFTKAKENIDSFLNDYAEKRSKKTVFLTKDELEKLKLEKKPEDSFFVRKKNSDATVYSRNTLTGTFYNSYTIERYGKIGINEFNISPEVEQKVVVKEETIEKKSHGVHVNFISELKNTLSKRLPVKEITIASKEKEDNPFVSSLVEGKKTLRHITPPPPRKFIFDEDIKILSSI